MDCVARTTAACQAAVTEMRWALQAAVMAAVVALSDLRRWVELKTEGPGRGEGTGRKIGEVIVFMGARSSMACCSPRPG